MPDFRAIEAQGTYADVLERHPGLAEDAGGRRHVPVLRAAPRHGSVEMTGSHLYQPVGDGGIGGPTGILEAVGLQLLVDCAGRRDQRHRPPGVPDTVQRPAVEARAFPERFVLSSNERGQAVVSVSRSEALAADSVLVGADWQASNATTVVRLVAPERATITFGPDGVGQLQVENRTSPAKVQRVRCDR